MQHGDNPADPRLSDLTDQDIAVLLARRQKRVFAELARRYARLVGVIILRINRSWIEDHPRVLSDATWKTLDIVASTLAASEEPQKLVLKDLVATTADHVAIMLWRSAHLSNGD